MLWSFCRPDENQIMFVFFLFFGANPRRRPTHNHFVMEPLKLLFWILDTLGFPRIATFHCIVTHLCTDSGHACLTSWLDWNWLSCAMSGQVLLQPGRWMSDYMCFKQLIAIKCLAKNSMDGLFFVISIHECCESPWSTVMVTKSLSHEMPPQ